MGDSGAFCAGEVANPMCCEQGEDARTPTSPIRGTPEIEAGGF